MECCPKFKLVLFTYPSWKGLIENEGPFITKEIKGKKTLEGDWRKRLSHSEWVSHISSRLADQVGYSSRLPTGARGDIRYASPACGELQCNCGQSKEEKGVSCQFFALLLLQKCCLVPIKPPSSALQSPHKFAEASCLLTTKPCSSYHLFNPTGCCMPLHSATSWKPFRKERFNTDLQEFRLEISGMPTAKRLHRL